MIKIYVGTMNSGEAEFLESKEMIFAQRDVQVTHYVISNEPEWEAHNHLWNAWNAAKNTHDLFVKIDADTILGRDTMLREIAETMLQNPRITGMQIPLKDYFTNELILGLNCFTPKVVFTPSKSKLYCDRVDTGHDIVLRDDAVKHLTPAGLHCKNPHPKQAFHFGLHRTLKNQKDKMIRIFQLWKESNCPIDSRWYALCGAYAASDFSLRDKFDYSNPEFTKAFDDYSLLKIDDIIVRIQLFIDHPQYTTYQSRFSVPL